MVWWFVVVSYKIYKIFRNTDRGNDNWLIKFDKPEANDKSKEYGVDG